MGRAVKERIELDELFLQMAELVSKRGTCNRLWVGCVIVKDKRVVSIGYNGSAPGEPHCLDDGCLFHMECKCGHKWIGVDTHCTFTPNCGPNSYVSTKSGCIRTIHGEANAIAWAAREGVSVKGATIYLTHDPCRDCSKLIASAGIIKVVFRNLYGRVPGTGTLENQGIEVQHGVG